MPHRAFTAGFAMMGAALAAATPAAAGVIVSPAPLPAAHDRPRVFLGGSIEMGSARDWQADLAAALADEPATLLNPRRADWNPAWKPVAEEPHFRQQVEWELAALDSADVIVMYLAPGTQSPISLLELGLHGRSGKVVVLCPDGFWRKGNVDITAERYGITRVANFDELVAEVRARLRRWKPA
ncbi:nucleoside 2-deoxyribosyltransferase domain-containing protein [Novosphingobium resinovorum]|uniref:nucleoside 2-deoxyribosyltransferase domain-containing protein n=1 Tax=Novosphingobium resinovorum TaxID=158500 RepID=UPI002ED209E9|nr:nucleoside 2-deoxyribosyltransferase domain-containing protein [Novosphingobium resinovorum]